MEYDFTDNYKYYRERKPFRINERGEALVFGFPLFGYYLPYIGFKKIEGESWLCLEWFLRGVYLGW